MRTRHLYFVGLLFVIASVVLASCGGDDGGGNTPPPATSLAMKGTSGNAVNMNGTWNGGCSYDAIAQENERDILTLNGGSATMVASIWSATTITNCTQTGAPDILFTVTVTATLDSGPTSTAIWVDGNGAIATPPAGILATAQATKAALVFNSATVTFGSAQYVADANGSSFCGFTNWAIGVPKNVLNCPQAIPSTTETDYWVVDDSAAQLKWYQGTNQVPWQVDNFGPFVK